MRRRFVSGLIGALLALGMVSEAAASTCMVCYGQGWIWGTKTVRPTPKITMIMPGDKNWLKGGATHYLHETRSAASYKTQVKQTCYRCRGSGYEPGYKPPTAAERAQSERDRRDNAVYVGNERFRAGPVWGLHGYGLIKKGEGKNTLYGIVGGPLTRPHFVLYPAWQHIDQLRNDVELVRAQRNGKWGYLNTDGKVEIADVYEEAMPFLKAAGGQAPVKKNGRWGVINLRGEVVLPMSYDALIWIERRQWFARIGSKWGVVSAGFSEPIVPIAFDYIRRNPVNGRFLVQQGDHFGLYDADGKLKVPARFDRFEAVINTYHVWDGDKVGAVVDGVVAVEPKFKSIEQTGELLVATKSNGQKVLHTKTGVSRSGVDDLEAVGSLVVTTKGSRKRLENAKGKVLVKSVESAALLPNGRVLVTTERGKGVYEGTGALVIKPGYDEIVVAAVADPMFVRRDTKWGVLTSAGKALVPIAYEKIERDASGFRVKNAGGWGLVGPEGGSLIEPKYESLSESQCGLRTAKLGGKLGFVDNQGRVVFPFDYDRVGPFEPEHPIVRVETAKRWGLLHCDGRVLLPVEWTYLKIERGTHAFAADANHQSSQFLVSDLLKGEIKNVRKADPPKPKPKPKSRESQRASADDPPRKASCNNGKWGFQDSSSKWIVPCKYDEVIPFSRGRKRSRTAAVRTGKKWGLVNDAGEVVLDVDYDAIRRLASHLVGIRDDDEWGVFNEELREVVLSPDCDRLHTLRGRVVCQEDDDWSWVRNDGDREDMSESNARSFGLKK